MKRTYRFFLALYGLSCAYVAGCSGGSAPVEVEGPGPGADETPLPSPGEGNTPPVGGTSSGSISSGNGSSGNGSSGTASGGTSSSSSSSTGSSSSGGACTTCSQLIAGATPGTYCTGSDTLYQSVIMCACGVDCSTDCTTFCSEFGSIIGTCLSCMETYCSTQLTACQDDF